MEQFKKQLIIELSISLLIVIALFAGILFFKGRVSDYTQGIVEARTLLASRTQSVSELAALRLEYKNEASKDLNILHNVIPSYDQLINFNRDIQSLAAQSKVSYGFSFAGETPQSAGGLGFISFNLNISSNSFDALMSFIKLLQNFRYLNSIDNISMKSENTNLIMAMKGRVFYR